MNTRTQFSFDPLDEFKGSKTAHQLRNEVLIKLRKAGIPCKGWVLKNQLREYAGMNQPDGRIRNVYMINLNTEDPILIGQAHEILERAIY